MNPKVHLYSIMNECYLLDEYYAASLLAIYAVAQGKTLLLGWQSKQSSMCKPFSWLAIFRNSCLCVAPGWLSKRPCVGFIRLTYMLYLSNCPSVDLAPGWLSKQLPKV